MATDAQARVEQLRREVEAGTTIELPPAVTEFVHRAIPRVTSILETARDEAEIVLAQVRAKPLTAVAVAALIGWVLSRAFR